MLLLPLVLLPISDASDYVPGPVLGATASIVHPPYEKIQLKLDPLAYRCASCPTQAHHPCEQDHEATRALGRPCGTRGKGHRVTALRVPRARPPCVSLPSGTSSSLATTHRSASQGPIMPEELQPATKDDCAPAQPMFSASASRLRSLAPAPQRQSRVRPRSMLSPEQTRRSRPSSSGRRARTAGRP